MFDLMGILMAEHGGYTNGISWDNYGIFMDIPQLSSSVAGKSVEIGGFDGTILNSKAFSRTSVLQIYSPWPHNYAENIEMTGLPQLHTSQL